MGLFRGAARYPEIRKLKLSMLVGLAVGLALAMIVAGLQKSAAGQPQQAENSTQSSNAPTEIPPPELPVVQDVASQVESLNSALAQASVQAATPAKETDILTQQEEHQVTFTIDLALQREVEKYLQRANPPEAAFVAINPKTGEVLALVGYENGRLNNYRALEARGPAASIFKLVTAAALVEARQVDPDTSVCYFGGKNGIKAAHLKANPNKDRTCETLVEAVGRSTNAVLAKLANQFLTRQDLHAYADRFQFNRHIPFFWPVEISRATVPEDRLQRANMAAGFHYSTLSPLHAALIAAAVANGGVMMTPRIVRETQGTQGETVSAGTPTVLDRMVTPEAAQALTEMMLATTTMGTASKYFRVGSKSPLAGISVAGKTGSLSSEPGTTPRLHYSWFVGFAPADNPQIAVAALTVNPQNWVLKSGPLAKMGLEAYFRHAGYDTLMLDRTAQK